jgi:hypothetical protein
VAGAVGPDLARDLEERHFTPYFQEGRWPDGLAAAMTRIWNALRDVEAPAEPGLLPGGSPADEPNATSDGQPAQEPGQ